MTREEQAKKECAIIVSDDMKPGPPFAAGYNKGIEAGVKWADSHPNWHRYPYDKPAIGTKCIIAVDFAQLGNITYHACKYEYNEFSQLKFVPLPDDYYIIAWMEQPELPNFQ